MTVQIDERKIVAGLFELIASNSSPDWFTEQELAVYLRLVNKDGKPVHLALGSGPHAILRIIRCHEDTSATCLDSIVPT